MWSGVGVGVEGSGRIGGEDVVSVVAHETVPESAGTWQSCGLYHPGLRVGEKESADYQWTISTYMYVNNTHTHVYTVCVYTCIYIPEPMLVAVHIHFFLQLLLQLPLVGVEEGVVESAIHSLLVVQSV